MEVFHARIDSMESGSVEGKSTKKKPRAERRRSNTMYVKKQLLRDKSKMMRAEGGDPLATYQGRCDVALA